MADKPDNKWDYNPDEVRLLAELSDDKELAEEVLNLLRYVDTCHEAKRTVEIRVETYQTKADQLTKELNDVEARLEDEIMATEGWKRQLTGERERFHKENEMLTQHIYEFCELHPQQSFRERERELQKALLVMRDDLDSMTEEREEAIEHVSALEEVNEELCKRVDKGNKVMERLLERVKELEELLDAKEYDFNRRENCEE